MTGNLIAYLGCTTEFRKWEGFTYDPATKKAYTAISSIERGMLNNEAKRDLGGPNHIKVKENKCGCVMEFDMDDSMSATKARMLTCGKYVNDDAEAVGRFKDSCDTDLIANPDNVAMISEFKQVRADCHAQ